MLKEHPSWKIIHTTLYPGKEGILESHMLEVCPTIADGPRSASKSSHFPWVTEKILQDLYLHLKTGPGIATSLIDLGTVSV